MINVYPLTEEELQKIIYEAIDIIHGKSKIEGRRPFQYGKRKIRNCIIKKVNCSNKDIYFEVVKDYSKRGYYKLQGFHYFSLAKGMIFEIPYTKKTTFTELYIKVKNEYDKYKERFNEYELHLSDGNKIHLRSDKTLEQIKKFYIGLWFKENKWYGLVVVGDENKYPRCINVIQK